jgi:multidrug efflux pump subunit AcrB
MVVALALFFSLVESKLILPAHLAHTKLEHLPEEELYKPYPEMPMHLRPLRFFQRFQRGFQNQLQKLIHGPYKRTLEKAIEARGITVSLFAAMLFITLGLMQSSIRFVLFPDVPGDFIIANFSMQSGTSPQVRNKALDRIEKAALELNQDLKTQNADGKAPINYIMLFTNGDTAGTIMLELTKSESRTILPDEITQLWRERVGDIPGARELRFSNGMNIGGGSPISFRLTGNNYDALEKAADELKAKLSEYNGVFDIRNSFSSGSEEIRLSIKPEAEALGLTQSDLGRQVRQAFYGEEAQRIQRGKDEIRVMVRYPLSERRSIADLEQMYIRTPSGTEVPFFSVADVEIGTSYSTIVRQDRKRAITVTADADLAVIEPGKLIQEIRTDYMPGLVSRYSGVDFELEGASLEEQKLIGNIIVAASIALFLIYALIAIPLRSYSQPLVIMSVIPFGLIGAIMGHLVFGKDVSMMSLFGLIALAGVVVNDSLIMIDFTNKARLAGMDRFEAVIQSGTQRFRAIILTSLTTAGGLLPIMTETSTQAQFVIPMAISMSFGIMFATVITLFLIPCLYLLLQDMKDYYGLGQVVH